MSREKRTKRGNNSVAAKKVIKSLESSENNSFAFTNTLRVIGLRDREKFHVLWYDARHEVYPSSK